MPGLIVPGTTIGVSLIPGYIEIRDRGIVRKKIPTKHRSFYAVLEEVEMYFRARRKMLPPDTLKDVLIRIGLPEAKKVVTEEDVQTTQEEVTELEKDQPTAEVAEEPEEQAGSPEPEEPVNEVPEVTDETQEEPVKVEGLSSNDLQDITEALSAVESLSDSFMAPKTKPAESTSKPVGVKISLSGASEVVSASSSFASAPKTSATDAEVQEEELEEESEVQEIDKSKATEENHIETPDLPAPMDEIETEMESPPYEEAEPEIEEPTPEIAWSAPKEQVAMPAHVVKPLVASKVLILGEEGVGKSSLMERAGLELADMDGELANRDPFVRAKVYETDSHRVKVQVWSFDEALQSHVSRSDFYKDADVLIIVYSASDRWSFESINFWLKESTLTKEQKPPIVIVGNKMDLVRESIEDSGDEPVSTEEGFALAEELAKRFAQNERLHPVAFIGTSCLTEEGVTDVFRTAAQLASARMS